MVASTSTTTRTSSPRSSRADGHVPRAAEVPPRLGTLGPHQQALFRAALALSVEDLRKGEGFRPSLRVKKVAGHDVWELTWAPDGCATFSYGKPVKLNEVHIVWHRVGT